MDEWSNIGIDSYRCQLQLQRWKRITVPIQDGQVIESDLNDNKVQIYIPDGSDHLKELSVLYQQLEWMMCDTDDFLQVIPVDSSEEEHECLAALKSLCFFFRRPSDTSKDCNRNEGPFTSLSQDSEPLPSHSASKTASPTAKPAETRAAWLRSECMVLTIFVLLDFFLIGLLAVAVSHAFFHHGYTTTSLQDDDHPLLLEDAPFCLPCREVYLTDQDVERNVFKVKQRVDEQENITLCCAESHDDLNVLIGEMYTEVRFVRERARGLMSWKKDDSEPKVLPGTIISHLSLHCTAEPAAGTDGTMILPLCQSKAAPGGRTADYTDSNNNITTTTNNNNNITNTTNTRPRHAAVVSNGSVRIQHSGHYYIYSHLPFNFRYSPPSTSSPSPSPSSPPSSDSEPISSDEPATQYVVRVRNGTDLVLLENSVYPCVVDLTRPRCEYSFVGGIFLLEENDELSLRVSHQARVEKGKGMSFGVQLM